MKSCNDCYWLRRLLCWTPCEESINHAFVRIDEELDEEEEDDACTSEEGHSWRHLAAYDYSTWFKCRRCGKVQEL